MKRGIERVIKRGLKRGFAASWLPVGSLRSSRTAGLAVSLLVLLLQSASVQAQPEPTLEGAAQAYHAGQYQRALNLYEQLAQSGNAEAALRAGFMLLQANGHFGLQVRRDADRAHALITQAARADHVAAGFMLNMLESTD